MITSKITLLLLCASILMVTGVARVQPPLTPDGPESLLPDEEKKIPPGDYCKRPDVTIGPRETHAHHCDCKFSCTVDEATGEITTHETINCQAWCEKNGRRCTCHTEEPCPEEGHHYIDMTGALIP